MSVPTTTNPSNFISFFLWSPGSINTCYRLASIHGYLPDNPFSFAKNKNDICIMTHDTKAFDFTTNLLEQLNFTIVQQDLSRPWGGFFVLDETQAADFAKHFFPDEDFEALKISEKLSPKILMVAPHKRLSWQYHHLRAEIWRCIEGEVAVATSHTDEEEEQHILKVGYKIKLEQGERHRLIGLDDWGIVAEIWQHTDAANPSDEDDIVRLQDDFGR